MGLSYCDIAPGHPWHGPYHDREYGFPIRRDAALFERLALEINQAGLSWLTILKKRRAFRLAFDGFDPEAVARYGKRDRARLLADAGIIRNRLKIDAAIENARSILSLRESHGSFARWLDAHHPRDREEWRALRRDLRLHRRRDRRRVHQHRLPSGSPPPELPDFRTCREPRPSLDSGRESLGADMPGSHRVSRMTVLRGVLVGFGRRGVFVGVGVAVSVAVGGADVGVAVTAAVGVRVAVGVLVAVAVGRGCVGVAVRVAVGVVAGIGVAVGVGAGGS